MKKKKKHSWRAFVEAKQKKSQNEIFANRVPDGLKKLIDKIEETVGDDIREDEIQETIHKFFFVVEKVKSSIPDLIEEKEPSYFQGTFLFDEAIEEEHVFLAANFLSREEIPNYIVEAVKHENQGEVNQAIKISPILDGVNHSTGFVCYVRSIDAYMVTCGFLGTCDRFIAGAYRMKKDALARLELTQKAITEINPLQIIESYGDIAFKFSLGVGDVPFILSDKIIEEIEKAQDKYIEYYEDETRKRRIAYCEKHNIPVEFNEH